MTGNDIVDLKIAATESNWQRKGFVEKIFTRQEQQYIKQASAPAKMVWKLWTMKESAYKIYTRQYGGRFFAPQKFNCTLLTEITGVVEFDNYSYQTTTFATKKYIYSIARPAGIAYTGFINTCFLLPQNQNQQQFVYKKIIEHYDAATGQTKKNISLIKDKNGIPFLYCGVNLQVSVSITHHGRFAAFTIH